MSNFQIREDFLPYNQPDITDAEVNEVVDTLRSGWIARGPRTVKFEAAFAEYLGAKHALALNSCTAALHVALLSAGIGEGDEVITTPDDVRLHGQHDPALRRNARFCGHRLPHRLHRPRAGQSEGDAAHEGHRPRALFGPGL